MDKEARGAIVGMTLGDGCITVRDRLKDGKYKYVQSELCITHCIAQKDYCEHKAGLIKKYLGGNFTLREFYIKPNGDRSGYTSVKFSASNSYFKQVKQWCYPNGKKTYTRFMLDMLTAEGIALWYMDDGHARRNINKDGWVSSVSTSIATMCSREEVDTIIQWFNDKHKIEWKPRYRKGSSDSVSWFIECNTENSRQFAHLVRPYIIDSMLYKLSHVADLTSHECRAPVAKCQCGGNIYDNRRGGLCDTCYSHRYYRNVRRHKEGRKIRIAGEDIVRTNGK